MSQSRVQAALVEFDGNGGYTPLGTFITADRQARELMVFMRTDVAAGRLDSNALVLSTKTGAWTEWDSGTDQYPSTGAYWQGVAHADAAGDVSTAVFDLLDDDTGNYEVRGFANEPNALTTNRGQTIGFSEADNGDQTHVQLWVSAAASFKTPPVSASWVFGNRSTILPLVASTPIPIGSATNRTARAWVPRAHARAPEMTAWLQGSSISLREIRLSYRSSGRRVPVGDEN